MALRDAWLRVVKTCRLAILRKTLSSSESGLSNLVEHSTGKSYWYIPGRCITYSEDAQSVASVEELEPGILDTPYCSPLMLASRLPALATLLSVDWLEELIKKM